MDGSVENTKYIEIIKKLRLLDDAFFGICIAEDDELIELILRILMNKADLKVIHSRNQYQIKNLLSHSAVLDVYAVDSNGRFYNIEVQRSNDGAYPQRARYYSSILDMDILRKNRKYKALPESYVFLITEEDVFKHDLPMYHVQRTILETNEAFQDGSNIIYVNTAYIENKSFNDLSSPVEKLMHDFRCTDPDKMYFKSLARKTRHYKNEPLGVRRMSNVMEELYNEAVDEVEAKYGDKIAELERAIDESERKLAQERDESERKLAQERDESERKLAQAKSDSRAVIMSAIRMMKDGIKVEKVSEYIGMPLEQVKELADLIA